MEKSYIISAMTLCPYCGSENWEWMNDDDGIDNYHCHECDRWFTKDDCESKVKIGQ